MGARPTLLRTSWASVGRTGGRTRAGQGKATGRGGENDGLRRAKTGDKRAVRRTGYVYVAMPGTRAVEPSVDEGKQAILVPNREAVCILINER